MLLVAFVSGLIISITYMKTYQEGNYSSNFALTMVLLPLVISLIIMLIGSDIARAFSLAGAFSIIRFRSAPGEPKDIGYILFAMSAGLASGVGAKGYAIVFTLMLCFIMFLLSKFRYAERRSTTQVLKITIPEDVEYQSIFPPLFDRYNIPFTLIHVKTTSLGSLYQLSYQVEVKQDLDIQEFMNEIRSRNSNLNISLNLMEQTS
jgi:hypothetical protein